MRKIKILWVEDEARYPDSVIYRIKKELVALGISLDDKEILPDGKFVWETVRDWQPDLIMMDHNLQDVTVNGANLIIQIRFHNNKTPIIFYSSEMGDELKQMIDGEEEVYTSPRGDLSDELIRILKLKFG